jgi:hypothetical protein
MDIWYKEALVRHEFSKTSLPAVDMVSHFQVFNFLFIFSLSGIQSAACNLLGLTGTPRYLNGNKPDWQLKISE